ncbi:MAG: amidohydrolase family protein [Bacteroidales bacterium]
MITSRKETVLLICILIYSCIGELTAQIPAPRQNGPVALTGGTIITVSGDTLNGGTLIFDNGVINYIGYEDVAEGTEVVDVSGKFVYPAMIHARSSVGLSEIGRVTETVDLSEHGRINPNVRAQVAYHAESEHIPLVRTHGIAVTVATPTGGIISGLSAAMVTDGWNWEEMTLKAPIAMVINWPDMSNARTRDRALQELSESFHSAKRYAQAKKFAGQKDIPHQNTDVRWEAMIQVIEGDIPVHIYANDLRQIQAAINWADKEKIKMVLVGGRDAGYLAPQLKEKNIPVIITPVINGPSRQWEPYDQSYSLPDKLYTAGVEFCIAGDFSAANAIRLSHHPSSAVAFGLPPGEALRSITLYPARILGLDGQMGSLDVGKDASIIVADGNLLELSTRIEQVYIQGRLVHMYDKHLRLYERYQERYRQISE